jgi:hypothetical protein
LDLIGLTNLLSAADNFTSDGTYMVLGDNLVTDNILCHKKEAIMNHIERSIVIFQENLEREEGTEFQEVVNRLKVFHFFFLWLSQLATSTAFRSSISGLATKRLTSTLNDMYY